MKTRKIKLVALLVLAAMMIIAIPVISSAEADPWTVVNPTSYVMSKEDSGGTAPIISAGGSTVMRRQQLSTSDADYNFQFAIPNKTAPIYTFSFSVMAEEGQKIMPLTFRERGYNDANLTSGSTGRSDKNIVSVASNGDIRAYSSASAYSVIGQITTGTLTNVTVCVDRTAGNITFFINGSLKKTVAISTDTGWLAAHQNWTHINMNPGKQTGTAENPLVIIHGSYSVINAKVTEDDALYFFHAFPHAVNRLDSVQGTLGDSLALNFRFFSESEAPTAEITIGGNTKALNVTADEDVYTVGTKTVRTFKTVYGEIGPHELGKSFTLTVKNGENVLFSLDYSALEYLDSAVIGNPGNTKLAALVGAIKAYGYEATEYLGNDASSFINVFSKDFSDTVNPQLQARGAETGTSYAITSVDDNNVLRVVGHKAYLNVIQMNALNKLVDGQTYHISLKYRVNRTVGEVENPAFNICYAKGDRYAGDVIATVHAGTIGEWATASFDFVCAKTDPANNGLSLYFNGLGVSELAQTDPDVGNPENTYEILIDDIVITLFHDAAAPEGEKAVPVNAGTAQIKSANVLFDAQNRIIVTYKSASAVTAKIDGADVVSEDLGDGTWRIATDGIKATDFDKEFTFTVGDSVLTYSVNDYAIAMKDNASISALTNAMYAYGVAAKAYTVIE